MEKISSRIVQNIGDSLFVSIPVQWAQDLGVEKGTILDLYRKGDQLIIMKKHE